MQKGAELDVLSSEREREVGEPPVLATLEEGQIQPKIVPPLEQGQMEGQRNYTSIPSAVDRLHELRMNSLFAVVLYAGLLIGVGLVFQIISITNRMTSVMSEIRSKGEG